MTGQRLRCSQPFSRMNCMIRSLSGAPLRIVGDPSRMSRSANPITPARSSGCLGKSVDLVERIAAHVDHVVQKCTPVRTACSSFSQSISAPCSTSFSTRPRLMEPRLHGSYANNGCSRRDWCSPSPSRGWDCPVDPVDEHHAGVPGLPCHFDDPVEDLPRLTS